MNWFFYALLSSFLWAFVPILTKLSSVRIDPVVITTIRSVIATIFLVVFCIFTKKCAGIPYCNTIPIDWFYLLLASILSGISWILFFTAIKYGFISKVIAVERISFVFILLLGAIILKEPLTIKIVIGSICMLAGMFVIIL